MGAVDFAGERIELRQLNELALALVPLVDGADDAMRARRLAVGTGKPAAGILDPELCRRRRGGRHIQSDRARPARRRSAPGRVTASKAVLPVGRLDPLREGAAVGDLRDIGDAKHRRGIAAPDERVGVEAPFVGGLADGGENPGGVE